MNKVQKIDYVKGLSDHLENHCVFEIFEKLTRQLIVHQPDLPIDFLIDRLKKPDGKRVFIVGPPGSNVRELTLQLSGHFETTVVSVGDLLKKEVSKKTEIGEKIDEYIKNMLYVPDDVVMQVLKEHLETLDREKDIIVEGFPKTAYQSMALIREGIIPDLFMVVNFSEEQNAEFAKKKFGEVENETWSEMSESERSVRGREYLQQYEMNIKELKQSYKNNLVELDSTPNNVLDEMAPLLNFRIKTAVKRSFRVMIVGPPGSGRSTIMNMFAKKYGFVPLSTSFLCQDQIERKTPVGAEIIDSFMSGRLVSDEIVFGLVKNRLERADCKLHGYVLEGYPKNENQLNQLENLEMKLKPHLFVVLDCEDSVCFERLNKKNIDPVTMNRYTSAEVDKLEPSIKGRVKALPNMAQDAIVKRLLRWKDFKEKLNSSKLELFSVDASQSISNILERISYKLDHLVSESK